MSTSLYSESSLAPGGEVVLVAAVGVAGPNRVFLEQVDLAAYAVGVEALWA